MVSSNFIYEWLYYSIAILWSGGRIVNKLKVLITFWKIHIKTLIVQVFKRNIKKEKILNFVVEFSTYETFASLFKEIFLSKVYHVNTETPEPFIIDCGSNIGMSLLYFKYLYPNSKIVAFEPNPGAYDFLIKNVMNNHLRNINVFNYALSNKKGTINLYIDSMIEDSCICGTTPHFLLERGKNIKEIIVKSVQLSEYITQSVDILKIDVEGAEGIILEEICEKLDMVKTLIIEFHYSPNFSNEKNDLIDILSILKSRGFKYSISSSIRRELLWDSTGKSFDLYIYAYKIRN